MLSRGFGGMEGIYKSIKGGDIIRVECGDVSERM